MRSSKSRSRSKNNRSRSVGNIVNRVFDSSGPEGKVRGTPQQIIDKYAQLARDAQLGNDRVATENFQQHAEHYVRMLGEAQREADARRELQEQQNRERQREREESRMQNTGPAPETAAPMPGDGEQPVVAAAPESSSVTPEPTNVAQDAPSAITEPSPASNDVVDLGPSEDSGLVETPESAPEKPAPKPRAPRKPRTRAKAAPKAEDTSNDSVAAEEKTAPKKSSKKSSGSSTSENAIDEGDPKEAAE